MAGFSFLIALFASVTGAISGIGGGVIIKPVLDAVSGYGVSTISFLSGLTVLSMALVSSLRQRGKNSLSDKPMAVFLSLGGVMGGLTGKTLFEWVKAGASESFVGAVQSACLLVLTLLVLVFMLNLKKIKMLKLKSVPAYLLVGLFLGLASSFLGIGGGPINIMALIFFFSLDNKGAAAYSLCVILFSQIASLILALFHGVPAFSPAALILMCLGGVSGGLIGSRAAISLSKERTAQFFSWVLVLIAVICVYNLMRFTGGL